MAIYNIHQRREVMLADSVSYNLFTLRKRKESHDGSEMSAGVWYCEAVVLRVYILGVTPLTHRKAL